MLYNVHQSTWTSFDICVKCIEKGVIWFFIPRVFVYIHNVKTVAGQQGMSFWVLKVPKQVTISAKFQWPSDINQSTTAIVAI